jgi:hypothetical protein
MTQLVSIVGARAVSPRSPNWRGALGNPRAEKMMSRSAYLAALCLRELLAQIGWRDGREQIGYFLGVGASGGSMADLTAMLRESIVDAGFSLDRFGEQGLAACNPLLAFQLMNNFALCHGAILEGIGGPNSAFFSRGVGTTVALIEAMQAIHDGTCDRAVAGGADSALHPVTRAELARGGYVDQGLVPAEGAALLALAAGSRGLGSIEGAAVVSRHGRPLADAVADSLHQVAADLSVIDLLVLAPWGPPIRDELLACLEPRLRSATVLDIAAAHGEALAATPALAWVAALDEIQEQRARRALILNAGIDGDLGAVVLRRGHAA